MNNRISFFVLAVTVWAIVLLCIDVSTKQFTNNSFFENLLFNAHGMIFDLIVLGIFLSLYEKIAHKKLEIVRLCEEIDDFRYWNDPEAMHRVKGIIKRLNNLNVFNIDLTGCILRNVRMVGFDLSKTTIAESDFESSDLNTSVFKNMKVHESNFSKCDLSSTIWTGTMVTRSSFRDAVFLNANLTKASFLETDMSNCDFLFAELESVHFYNVKLTNAKAFMYQKAFFEQEGVDLSDMHFIPNPEKTVEPSRSLYVAEPEKKDGYGLIPIKRREEPQFIRGWPDIVYPFKTPVDDMEEYLSRPPTFGKYVKHTAINLSVGLSKIYQRNAKAAKTPVHLDLGSKDKIVINLGSFGGNIRKYREEKSFTIEVLAHLAGISVDQVREIEAGRHYPGQQTINRIAAALDVDFKRFYDPKR